MEPKKVWRYGVQVTGIKKRSRKSDLHIASKLEESEELDQDLAKQVAREWIAKNMKTSTKATARAELWTILCDGVEQWEPFTTAHNHSFSLE